MTRIEELEAELAERTMDCNDLMVEVEIQRMKLKTATVLASELDTLNNMCRAIVQHAYPEGKARDTGSERLNHYLGLLWAWFKGRGG